MNFSSACSIRDSLCDVLILDIFLQTAVSGQADVLCTRDAAFRQQLVEEVCHAQGIRLLDDIVLMQELRDNVTA